MSSVETEMLNYVLKLDLLCRKMYFFMNKKVTLEQKMLSAHRKRISQENKMATNTGSGTY
jgi:hypothetical protein